MMPTTREGMYWRQRQIAAKLAADVPSVQEEFAAPPPARDEPDPQITEARARLATAQAALDQAESGYATLSSKSTWSAVEAARVERDKCAVVAKKIEARIQAEIAACVEAARAAQLKRYDELVAQCDESAWRKALEPVLKEAIAIDLRRFELNRKLDQIDREQMRCAYEAASIARQLGEPLQPPAQRSGQHNARAYLSYALHDARNGVGITPSVGNSHYLYWTSVDSQGMRAAPSFAAWLDSVVGEK